MQLRLWLEYTGMTIDELAQKLGKNRSLVFKYVHGIVIPRHDIMIKIYKLTLGSVCPCDFHGISDDLFKCDPKESTSLGVVLDINSFQY